MNSLNAFDAPPRYQPAAWPEHLLLLCLMVGASAAIWSANVNAWLGVVLTLLMLLSAAFEYWLWREKRAAALWLTHDEGWLMSDNEQRRIAVIDIQLSLDWSWLMLLRIDAANGSRFLMLLLPWTISNEAFYAMRRHCVMKSE